MSLLNVLNNAKKSIVEYFFYDESDMIEHEELASIEKNAINTQNTVSAKQQTTVTRVKVANGADIVYETTDSTPSFSTLKQNKQYKTNKAVEQKRPYLQVVKQEKFSIRTFNVSNFSDTKSAADALKQGKCIILNFEKTDFKEQHRICDFLNGACYVLGGSVLRITSTMMVYAPAGINLHRTKK